MLLFSKVQKVPGVHSDIRVNYDRSIWQLVWTDIFLRIGIHSMLKYPLQARQYEIECTKACFVYLQIEKNFCASPELIECLAYLIAD